MRPLRKTAAPNGPSARCCPICSRNGPSASSPRRKNPTATADAYLLHERGLDLQYLRGSYTQELYREGNQTSATVRFPVGDTFWERLIDKPARFEKKAHFQKGGKPGGHCWIPPRIDWETLARADDIWITEGIFNAAALAQGAGLAVVSAMSSNYWPEHFLDRLREELQRIKRPTRPRLVFAFDPGGAGVKYARRFVLQARDQGWAATAAQVTPDGEGTDLDWNDLLLRHQQWKGDAEKAPPKPEGYRGIPAQRRGHRRRNAPRQGEADL
ncbi:hypothetical protein ACFSTD_09675 [Novosphingobium colocasiae]